MGARVAGNRIGSIDALRGIAALCVCVQHGVQPIVTHPATAPAVRRWLSMLTVDGFDLGRYGVILFFLISGYVIPFSLRGTHALPRFAITRVLRLYPAFWLSVIAVVMTSAAMPSVARFAANLTMAPAMFGAAPVSGVYWTLFVELVFYLLCAALFATGQLRRTSAVFVLGLGCAALPLMGVVLRGAPIVYLGAHLSFLFAGTLMRFASEQRTGAARLRATALTLVALAVMPILAQQPDHSFTLSTPLGVTLAGGAAVASFVALHDRAGLALPILLRLGAISYALYLFHVPVARVAERVIAPASLPAALLYLTLMLGGSLMLAAAVYTWLERPMIARGKRWSPGHRLGVAVAP